MEHQTHIGIVNQHGHIVLQSKPEAIQIELCGEPMTLDLYTGSSYTMPCGRWMGELVQPGDYVGGVGGSVWRSERWLLSHPSDWKKVR